MDSRPTWMRFAACRKVDRETLNCFFVDGQGGSYDKQRERAKAVCRECSVLNACYDWIMSKPAGFDQGGVVAGMSWSVRDKIRRGKREGRSAPSADPPSVKRPAS